MTTTPAPASAARLALRAAHAQHRAAVTTLESLRAPLARLEAAAAAEREAERALAEIDDAESARFLAWSQTGNGQMPTPDTKGREAAERKLSATRATAAAARAAAERLTVQMQEAATAAGAAERTLREPQAAVVVEAAEALAAEYRAVVERAAILWGQLNGLDAFLFSHFGDVKITNAHGATRMAGIRFDRREQSREFPVLAFDLDAVDRKAVLIIEVPQTAFAEGQEYARAALAAAVSDAEG